MQIRDLIDLMPLWKAAYNPSHASKSTVAGEG
jgi:hypothetical protein